MFKPHSNHSVKLKTHIIIIILITSLSDRTRDCHFGHYNRLFTYLLQTGRLTMKTISYKYERITTDQPDTNRDPNPNLILYYRARNSYHSTKYSRMCFVSREILTRQHVVASFLQLSVVIVVTLPSNPHQFPRQRSVVREWTNAEAIVPFAAIESAPLVLVECWHKVIDSVQMFDLDGQAWPSTIRFITELSSFHRYPQVLVSVLAQ